VIEPHDGDEEAGHFLGAENNGEILEAFGAREVREDLGPPQSDVIEEPQGLEVEVVVGPGLLPLLDHVEELGVDVVWSKEFGGPAEMPGKACDAVDIDSAGRSCAAACPEFMRRRSGVMVSSLAEVRRRTKGNAPGDVSAGARIGAGGGESGMIGASRGLRVAEGWRGRAGRRSQEELRFRLYREAVSFNSR
jgi:hypothetical protein